MYLNTSLVETPLQHRAQLHNPVGDRKVGKELYF